MQKKVLVTGGCGFIGSHTIALLIEKGYDVVSLDNFSNSHKAALKGLEKLTGRTITNLEVNLCDRLQTMKVITEAAPFDAVIHFAAYKSVGESMAKPFMYYQNNIPSVINIAEAAVRNGIQHFIFSSSCTVYGDAEVIPVTENTPIGRALSPYGLTKITAEAQLADINERYKWFKPTFLRYFNPAGAHESALIGEASRRPSTNLVPIICEVVAGKREKLTVYGDDYQTRDGSCIRDYVHVMDLAEAHISALELSIKQESKTDIESFNLGIGEGVSVLEAITAFEEVTGKKVIYSIGDKRPGDVSAIFADYTKAAKVLNWKPKRTIEDIMETAWKWEQVRW